MKARLIITLLLITFLLPNLLFSQNTNFQNLEVLIGSWKGNGSGFSGGTSTITTSFAYALDQKYIYTKNQSSFPPSEENAKGDEHQDWGMISYHKGKKAIIYRQFHNEGYVIEYALNDSLSSDNTFVFESFSIDNFVPGGRARFTILMKAKNVIETIFDISFPGKEFACFGKNTLVRKEN
jgi:hypothetical protein